jgi:hypothetical protein
LLSRFAVYQEAISLQLFALALRLAFVRNKKERAERTREIKIKEEFIAFVISVE